MADKYNLRAWKRPVSRSYEFNLQVGENYYKHLTTYLDQKSTGYAVELPGALSYRYNQYLDYFSDNKHKYLYLIL